MSGDTLDDLFEEGLKEMYYVENELLDVLDELSNDVDHDDIEHAFRQHREETEEHVDRLEEVFDHIGESPEKKTVHGLDGLVQDHREFTDNDPEQNVHNLFDVAAAEKTEHLEIAAYGNLTFIADKLGHDEAADLLEANLREEEEALDELKSLTEDYDVEAVPAQG
ncbi:YciE/YciF ferroxidase family protein [Haladaptatus sp. NG-SE-30]